MVLPLFNVNKPEAILLSTHDLNEFPSAVREFAIYKRSIQGCSQKTVDEYLLDIRTFVKFLILREKGIKYTAETANSLDISGIDIDFFERVTTAAVYDFLYFLGSAKKDENSTKARKLSAIKSLYKFLTVKKNYFENNPCANIETPKKKKQLPKHLSVDESLRLLNAVRSDKNSKTTDRDFAILTLFLNCGMRVSELAGIDVSDISDDLKSLRVVGKGSKERIIYLNDACRDALNAYLPKRIAEHSAKEQNALFLSGHGRGNRLSVKTIQYIVYKYLKLAGLENKHYSVHKLRHTAATLMYQTGEVDIRVLKEILGHEQLNTTQIYTHVANKNLEEAMAKNPLASVKAIKKKKPDDNEDTTDAKEGKIEKQISDTE